MTYHALVMSAEGDVYETTMDDIELSIVLGYCPWLLSLVIGQKTRNIWR